MALLSNKNKELLNQVFADEESNERRKVVPGKQDIRAAIDAVDNWLEANRASFNAAIPAPAKSGLTSRQKMKLLMLIINKRWEVS